MHYVTGTAFPLIKHVRVGLQYEYNNVYALLDLVQVQSKLKILGRGDGAWIHPCDKFANLWLFETVSGPLRPPLL